MYLLSLYFLENVKHGTQIFSSILRIQINTEIRIQQLTTQSANCDRPLINHYEHERACPSE